jgi:hypothetical protein
MRGAFKSLSVFIKMFPAIFASLHSLLFVNFDLI